MGSCVGRGTDGQAVVGVSVLRHGCWAQSCGAEWGPACLPASHHQVTWTVLAEELKHCPVSVGSVRQEMYGAGCV